MSEDEKKEDVVEGVDSAVEGADSTVETPVEATPEVPASDEAVAGEKLEEDPA